MIPLNQHEMAWFNHNRQALRLPEGSSVAAEVFTSKGVDGLTKLHRAIIARDINRIQKLLDN